MYLKAREFTSWDISEAGTVKLLPVTNLKAKAEAQIQAIVQVHGSIGKRILMYSLLF